MCRGSTKKQSRLFRTLSLGIMGICLIAVLVLLLYLFLHSDFVYRIKTSREMKEYAQDASDAFASMLDGYTELVEDLAQSSELIKQLKAHGVSGTPDVYRTLYQTRLKTDEYATLHLLSPSRKQAVSLGYNSHEYQIGNYAGIDQLLQSNDSPAVVTPKHFINTNGEYVALVVAKKISDGNDLLGYICLDISQAGITHFLENDSALKLLRPTPYVEHIICTWYDYVIFDESLMSSLYFSSSFLSNEFTNAFKQDTPASVSLNDGGDEMMVAGVENAQYRFIMIGVMSMEFFLRENERNVFPIIIICLLIAAVGSFVAWKINQEVLQPIGNILDTLQRFDNGDMSVRCHFQTNNELSMIRDQLNQLIVDVDQTMKNNQEKQELLMVAENNVLKAQIKPHFINNVLDSIYWMIKIDKIDEACIALTSIGKIITARMNCSAASHETLDDSLSLTRQYITLQQLCYPNKFEVKTDIAPDAGTALIPVFLLQPLVENAIHHGLQPKLGLGLVSIRAYAAARTLHIVIADDGVGMNEETLNSILVPHRSDHGIALYNIYRRIQLFYGDAGKFQIRSAPDTGTVVTVEIPLEDERRGICSQ